MPNTCPECRTQNPADHRFCAECGAALGLDCPACGFHNDAGGKFCGGCGASLGAPARAPEPSRSDAARRHLTVMFCDLVGSTAMSEKLDPEDLREVIRSYQDACLKVVERFEGYVARFMGDGIMIYFGYPRAHEDDAERAVRAGLEIIDAVDALNEDSPYRDAVHHAVRIGIASGTVVVGDLIGEGASEEKAVVGVTPNIAARLQGLAGPGALVIGDATLALVRGLFEVEHLGAHAVKGVAEPINVWRVLRPAENETRFDARLGAGLGPLVGRSDELSRLEQVWQSACAGRGGVALVRAEPGIGKSRLAAALRERAAADEHYLLRYQCSAYHTSSALYPFIRQLERAAELERAESNEHRLARLRHVVAEGAGDERAFELLAALLSLPTATPDLVAAMSPEERKRSTFAVLVRQMQGLAARKPVLVLFEDAHWADPTSLELLEQATDAMHAARVLMVVTARAGFAPAWHDRRHVQTVELGRLDAAQSAELARRTAGVAQLPAALLEGILAKSDGIPLFIEEITKAVLEAGGASKDTGDAGAAGPSIAIPETLQDSLLARLTNLSSTREVAQLAAAIGREFSHDLLAAASDMPAAALEDAMNRLVEAEIVYRSVRGNVISYSFKHALIQDAAYTSLLRGRRRELHVRIAEALERHHRERAAVEPELFAHHFTLAERPREAIVYWSQAAKRALTRSANREVLAHVGRALELVTQLPDSPQRAKAELGLQILRGAACRAVYGFAARETEAAFSRARELCDTVGDPHQLGDVLRGLYACYYIRGELNRAHAQASQVLALAERGGEEPMVMAGHWMLGCVAFWQGRFGEARERLERAVELYTATGQANRTLSAQIDPALSAMIHLGWALWILGRPEQGVAKSEEAIALARGLEQPFGLAQALFWSAAIRVCCGDFEGAERLLPELCELTERHGITYLRSCATLCEGQTLIARGDFASGLQRVQQALTEFGAQEAGVGRPWAVSAPVAALTAVGKPADGLKMLEIGFAAAAKNDERQWESELHRLRGEALLAAADGDDSEATACFRRAIELAHEQGALSLELRACSSLARTLAGQPGAADARERLQHTYDRFEEGFETADLRAACALLERLASG